MREARKRRLTITGFILVIAMFFVGFIYSVFFSSREDSYWAHFQQRAKLAKTSESAKRRIDVYDPFTLYLGEVMPVGKIKLVYRGRVDKVLNIGVIINDLDPQMEYVHRIPLRQTDEGVRLGGVPFRVLSSGSSRLQLQRKKQQ
jgi:hypothetical protein